MVATKHARAARLPALAALWAVWLLAGCAWPGAPRKGTWIDPSMAVQLAAAAQGRQVEGVFAFRVRAADFADRLFLNSEADYRDQRNLTVAIDAPAAAAWLQQLGLEDAGQLVGRRVQVQGGARRVRIDFTIGTRPSGKYYYQTQVWVSDPAQLRLLP